MLNNILSICFLILFYFFPYFNSIYRSNCNSKAECRIIEEYQEMLRVAWIAIEDLQLACST